MKCIVKGCTKEMVNGRYCNAHVPDWDANAAVQWETMRWASFESWNNGNYPVPKIIIPNVSNKYMVIGSDIDGKTKTMFTDAYNKNEAHKYFNTIYPEYDHHVFIIQEHSLYDDEV